MSYRLKLKEPLAKGVRRIAVEQLSLAEQRLAEPDGATSAVHEARKALKRTRALLRLIRPALDEGRFTRENRRLAEIGRRLSLERDREVVEALLAQLAAESNARGRAAAALLDLVVTERAREAVDRAAIDKEARAALAKAKEHAARLDLAPGDWEHVGQGLVRSYKSGRKALARAIENPADVEPLHDLRKACQVHWRQMLLLQRAWPEMLALRAQSAKEVSQILGDDHDIELLAAAITRHGDTLEAAHRAALTSYAEVRHRHLREAGLFKAQQLFAEKPRRFARQIVELWQLARGEQGAGRRNEAEPAKDAVEQLVQKPVAAKPRTPRKPPAARAVASKSTAPSRRKSPRPRRPPKP